MSMSHISRRANYWFRKLVLTGLIFLGSFAQGLSIKAVSGASAYNLGTSSGTTTATPIIYGGTAGSAGCSANTNCNSCANETSLKPCNRSQIGPNTVLTLSFVSDTASGIPSITAPSSTSAFKVGTNTQAKNTATITLTWSDICSHFASGTSSSCNDGTNYAAGNFTLFVDANSNGTYDTNEDHQEVSFRVMNPDPLGTDTTYYTIDQCSATSAPGICYFMAYPGDQKVFLNQDQPQFGSSSTLPWGQLAAVNVYPLTTGWITKPSDATPVTLALETNSSTGVSEITDGVVTGLSNGVPYYFRVSVSDQAANEMLFTSDANINDNCTITLGVSPLPTPPFDGSGAGAACPYAAYPDEVLGLLNKDFNCFIATAAFGSRLHPLVQRLREFRNEFLHPYSWGRGFVRWYYTWSPKAAHYLREHEGWRHLTRAALIPTWLAAESLLHWPITLVAILGLLVWRRSRKKPSSQ